MYSYTDFISWLGKAGDLAIYNLFQGGIPEYSRWKTAAQSGQLGDVYTVINGTSSSTDNVPAQSTQTSQPSPTTTTSPNSTYVNPIQANINNATNAADLTSITDWVDNNAPWATDTSAEESNPWLSQLQSGLEMPNANVPEGWTVAYDNDTSRWYLKQLTPSSSGTSAYGQPEVQNIGGYSIMILRDTAGNIVSVQNMGSAAEATNAGGLTPYQQETLNQNSTQQSQDYQLAQAQLQNNYNQAVAQLAQQQAEFGATQELQIKKMELDQWYQQNSLALQQSSQEFNQWYQTQALGEEQKKYEAQLRANPAAWLQYNLYTGQTPMVQPWQKPLMDQEYASLNNVDVGSPMPGWEDYKIPAQNITPTYQGGTYQLSQAPSLGSANNSSGANQNVTINPYSLNGTNGNDGSLSLNGNTNLQGGSIEAAASATGLPVENIKAMMTNTGVDADTAAKLILANRTVSTGSTGNAPALTTDQQKLLQQYMPSSYQMYTAQTLNPQQASGATEYLSNNPTYMNNSPWATRAASVVDAGLLNGTNGTESTNNSSIDEDEIARQKQLQAAATAGFAGYARGGKPKQGVPFVVGERGPELGYMKNGRLSITPLPGLGTGGVVDSDNIMLYDSNAPPRDSEAWNSWQASPPVEAQSAPTTAPKQMSSVFGSSTGSSLPFLYTPSTQYQARMGPTAKAQMEGYATMYSGITPDELQYRLWSMAPSTAHKQIQYR
jgi:hypothetical protein